MLTQMELISKIIKVLTPVGEITQSISSEVSSASVIIPFIRPLRRYLENHDDNDRCVRTMKQEMLASLKRRYRAVESHESLVLATPLDP